MDACVRIAGRVLEWLWNRCIVSLLFAAVVVEEAFAVLTDSEAWSEHGLNVCACVRVW